MSDNAVVHIGENSPEQVAYKLMRDIARAEKIYLEGTSQNASREWILRTYMQCRHAVQGYGNPDHVMETYKAQR